MGVTWYIQSDRKNVHQEYPTQQGYHLGLKEKEFYREAKAKRCFKYLTVIVSRNKAADVYLLVEKKRASVEVWKLWKKKSHW